MTPDRTTIKAAITNLVTSLRTNLVADPPTDSKPFREVQPGDGDAESFVRPFLLVRLIAAEPVGMVDDDKVLEVSMKFRIVTDVIASDPHDAILDKVGAVDDYLDSLIDTGVLDGAEGFDHRRWSFEYPLAAAGARLAAAEASQTFIVKVERQQNREPAS